MLEQRRGPNGARPNGARPNGARPNGAGPTRRKTRTAQGPDSTRPTRRKTQTARARTGLSFRAEPPKATGVIPSEAAKRRGRGIPVVPKETPSTRTSAIPRSDRAVAYARNDNPSILRHPPARQQALSRRCRGWSVRSLAFGAVWDFASFGISRCLELRALRPWLSRHCVVSMPAPSGAGTPDPTPRGWTRAVSTGRVHNAATRCRGGSARRCANPAGWSRPRTGSHRRG